MVSKYTISILSFLSLLTFCAQSQVMSDSFLIGGHYRTFHFNAPQNSNRASSLIFVLHGSGGNGIRSMGGAKKLVAKSNSDNLLILFPDAYLKNWNECRKDVKAAANTENIDENLFFTKMIDYCVANYKINHNKVFVIGSSGGGHMAYKLAYTMPEKIKAITAIISNIPDSSNMDCIRKNIALPVMIINGTADSTNPYNGGKMKGKGLVQSTANSFNYWATLAGYSGQPTMEALPDTDPTDGKTIEKFTYKQKDKPEVVLLKVINGEHGNPKDIDVFVESWNFFKRAMEVK
jgi:polyhydroxybutyrate depolymerase